MKSIYIICGCISFLVGIASASALKTEFLFPGILIFWSFILIKRFKSISICILFFAFGIARYWLSLPYIDEESIHYYRDEKKNITVRGVIALDPDRRREKVNYVIDVSDVSINGVLKNVHGRVLVPYALYPEFEYGEQVEVSGILIEPPEFEGFSYRNYLSLSSVYSIMQNPYIKGLKDPDFKFKGLLFSFKDSFESRLNKLFPEPSASFEAGLLTGSRKGIPDEILEAFNITGLTHIIAISGYNISLIIVLISSLFKSSSRKVKVPFIILFIILFTIFVGASAAVVRASIMGIVSVMALWFGRQSKVINALLISAFVMALWNPMTFLYDVGFQLSFLATLGLILVGNQIVSFVKFLPEKFGIREACAMTLSAQIFALPVILTNFGRFSLISPVANIFIVSFIPFAMFFGFIAAILSVISFNAGFVFAMPAWLMLQVAVFITKLLAGLPMAAYEVEWFNHYWAVAYYLICVFAYFVHKYFRPVFLRR